MKAETQKAIGEATARILAVLSGYKLVLALNLLAPHSFTAWFSGTSFVPFFGTSATLALSSAYAYAITRNKRRTVETVCRIWLVLGMVGLGGALLVLASTGILTKSFGVLFVMFVFLLRVSLPFASITLV